MYCKLAHAMFLLHHILVIFKNLNHRPNKLYQVHINLPGTLKEPLIRSGGKSLAQGQMTLIDPIWLLGNSLSETGAPAPANLRRAAFLHGNAEC